MLNEKITKNMKIVFELVSEKKSKLNLTTQAGWVGGGGEE